MMKYFFLLACLPQLLMAQEQPDKLYVNNIRTIQLYQQNNQTSLPVINLNSSALVELHFDDLDGYVKNYFYTYQLCNENWEEVNLSPFDYIKGFVQNRITQYRVSSIAQTPYVHYQALLPDRGSVPTRSGNYLLKVFLNGNLNNVVFTKRLYVVDNKAPISAQVLQTFDNTKFLTHQRVQVSVNIGQLNPPNVQQQVKVVIMQNNRMDNLVRNILPAFIRGNVLEYNGELDCTFEAGKEYRWADLRSYRFESERVQSIEKTIFPNTVLMKPDVCRSKMRYAFFRDLNGWYTIESTENINQFWQTDYANVTFTYVPEDNKPYYQKDVYISSAFTGGYLNDSSKMNYVEGEGIYQKTFFLKNGFYTYNFLTKDVNKPKAAGELKLTEGNFWETDNDYTVFVYYRSLQGRHDELVGFTTVNSRLGFPR